jgi:hypothetical protein
MHVRIFNVLVNRFRGGAEIRFPPMYVLVSKRQAKRSDIILANSDVTTKKIMYQLL